eukprot:CAMPEP_0183465928 /NCGR_PEP_ID=MMETSP0370-20130417/148089_1 /TAXON_ID=268820 /ORGANISM="Peridinium aciculiferum, Strain PAER-2" /LENGTH=167 /DNA_ID=CAMNT_0025658169 /DNA_START=59 /DNA_END=562 /DNA_ORIENTATION=+
MPHSLGLDSIVADVAPGSLQPLRAEVVGLSANAHQAIPEDEGLYIRLYVGHQHINTQIHLAAIDQQRVSDVLRDNTWLLDNAGLGQRRIASSKHLDVPALALLTRLDNPDFVRICPFATEPVLQNRPVFWQNEGLRTEAQSTQQACQAVLRTQFLLAWEVIHHTAGP